MGPMTNEIGPNADPAWDRAFVKSLFDAFISDQLSNDFLEFRP